VTLLRRKSTVNAITVECNKFLDSYMYLGTSNVYEKL